MLTDEALTGRNLKAADMLIDLMGESVQRENHALKRKELKLKEDAVKGVPKNQKNLRYIKPWRTIQNDL